MEEEEIPLKTISLTIGPKRTRITQEILNQYEEVLKNDLDSHAVKYAYAFEKGSYDHNTHIQCVCTTKETKKTLKQRLGRHMSHLPEFGDRTVEACNRTKEGDVMYGYIMKERPDHVVTKGLTEEELNKFAEDFAKNLPNYKEQNEVVASEKERRCSFKSYIQEDVINFIWKNIVYLDYERAHINKEEYEQFVKRARCDSTSTTCTSTSNSSETEETRLSSESSSTSGSVGQECDRGVYNSEDSLEFY